MKVVITGNMGYVGSVAVNYLRKRYPKAELVGYDAGFFAHCTTTAGPLPDTLLSMQLFGDLREFPADVLRGAHAVINLAAVSNDPIGREFESATMQINRDASIRLARLACDAGVKSFVHASSCSIYGFAETGRRKESDPADPLTVYARSKLEAEQAYAAFEQEAMTVTCLRFATACGMSPRLRLDLVLNDFVACAMTQGEILILSDGSPWRPLIDVSDMARAMDWAIGRSPDQGGNVLSINVGADHWNYRVRELADAVASEVEGATVRVAPNASSDKRSYQVDFSLFRSLAPAYQPQMDLPTSIKGLMHGLDQIAFSDRDFRRSSKMRLYALRAMIEDGFLSRDLRWRYNALTNPE